MRAIRTVRAASIIGGALIWAGLMVGPAAAAPRTVSISNATITEGDSGLRTAHFDLTLSRASSRRVVVHFATVNGTAKAGKDYEARDGRRVFEPGEKTESIGIRVIGDEIDEFNERFFVKLSNPVHAELGDRRGRGTIEDDDSPPNMSIVDDSTTEGGSAALPVRLSRRSGKRITVDYATGNGTATANFDYSPEDSTLVFRPGDKQVVVTIDTIDDGLDELDETFEVDLSGATHAMITDGHGVGTILDND